jgi:hypothetical protein
VVRVTGDDHLARWREWVLRNDQLRPEPVPSCDFCGKQYPNGEGLHESEVGGLRLWLCNDLHGCVARHIERRRGQA